MAQASTATARREAAALPRPYRVARVEKADRPEGGEGKDWYRYVLDNGHSTITGQRQGSLKHVTEYAKHCAEELNARAIGGQSVWSPRRGKAVVRNSASE